MEDRAMSERLLRDRHILLVEDDYLIAAAMQLGLEDAGAHVVGPAASVGDALALLDSEPVDGAILDVSLNNEKVYPVAEILTARGIPFIFTTGYSASDLPPAWQHILRHEKPVDAATVARALLGQNSLIDSEADGCGDANRGHEGAGAAIITGVEVLSV